MTQTMSLAELVRHLRLQSRLSQEALAERAGLSARTISDIESGVARAPRPITLSLLSEALDASAEDRERLRAAGRTQRAPFTATEDLEPLAQVIGREGELAGLTQLISQGVRLLTIVGPPGVGKTALAAHLARRLAPQFERLATVELAAVASPDAVPGAIAQGFGAQRVRSETDADDVAAAIGSARTLLVLDNVEHVAESARFIGELLAAAPSLTIISTGRAPLRQSLEQRFSLEPLRADAAIELLIARSVADGRNPAGDNASLSALAEQLEGIPLAIELAAPLLRVLSPVALVRRLGQRLPLLAAEGDAGPARHRTMRAAIDWSYQLVSADAQRLFRRLSVLRAPFTAETAQMIADPDRTTLDTLRVIAELVDHNLLRATAADDEPRFEFLATVREYGEEQLQASGEYDETSDRLVQHCERVAQLVAFDVPQTQTNELVARVAAESANRDRAFAWLRARGRTAEAMQMALGFYTYWWLRDPAAGQRCLLDLIADAQTSAAPIDPMLVAKIYVRATGLTEVCGSLDAADALGEKALVLRRALGDELGAAAVLNGFGARAMRRGNYDDARRHLEHALAIRRRLGADTDVGMSLNDLASAAIMSGDSAGAAAYLDEAIATWRRAGSDLGIGMAFVMLGMIALREEFYDRADAFSREGLALATAVGHGPTIATARLTLARLALHTGDLATARADADAAMTLFAANGAPADRALTLEVSAEIAHASGDAVAAARALGAAQALRTRERTPVAPSEQAAQNQRIAAIRAALGAEAFETELTIGAALGAEGAD
jgi:predicted ATPase/DNA-binding XRE family transcriptional regulator/Tfp pilus assembly protein PilF